jgi:cytochrome c553
MRTCILAAMAVMFPFVALALARGRGDEASAAATGGREAGLGEEAHAVLTRRCGSCHHSATSRDNPSALEIFDLKERDWAARLSDGQLPKLVSRIESFGGSEQERAHVEAFVRAEATRRAGRR